ncbi:MAG: 3-phosphoglycerate dehydrogenase, partial [Boseongicola sp. SB0673_bin_14]|nr:3-phosphoglycerate dehydrogenase [Boseongicola sp. SB0673_bin_14]
MMYKIRTYNQIAVRGLERFPRQRYELGTEIADPDSKLLRSNKLTEDDVQDRLRAIA